MRAAILEEQGAPIMVRDDVVSEAPKPGQVAVRITHCGICHSDLSLADGAFPCPTPIVLGHEAAGVVEDIGAGVMGLVPGDHVVITPCPPCGVCYWCVRAEASLCVNSIGLITNTFPDGSTGLSRDGRSIYRGVNVGGFAERVLTMATGAVRIPADVPLGIACLIGCSIQTGVGAVLNTARLEEGSTVLVTGLGGVGLSVVQGARLAGAARILVSDPLAGRREAARDLGATDFLDPAVGDLVEQVQALTLGIGVDAAFEAAGRAVLIDQCMKATRNGGTIVVVGAPPLDDLLTLLPAGLVITGKRLLGTVLGSSNSLRDIPRFIELWRAGRLDLERMITARRPLSEINEGFADMRRGIGIRTVIEMG